MFNMIDGKQISASVKQRVLTETEKLRQNNITATLAVVIVGNNPASRVYVNNKKKACEVCGIVSREYALDENTPEEELLKLVHNLNHDQTVNGILVQLPLPKQINETAVINAIDPVKDVDAFHPSNVGRIMIGNPAFLPCTPAGIMELMRASGIDPAGKDCVVIGRSNIVGKPMAMLMLAANATVTICHSKTVGLKEKCKNADILIAAVGKEKFVTADMVKEGAVVIDVGMNRDANGKLCGDVDFEHVKEHTSYITPVPGGVGPMTIAMLMQNTLTAVKLQNQIIAL